jgi:hypothetical protein
VIACRYRGAYKGGKNREHGGKPPMSDSDELGRCVLNRLDAVMSRALSHDMLNVHFYGVFREFQSGGD